jgi:hypothetical protein
MRICSPSGYVRCVRISLGCQNGCQTRDAFRTGGGIPDYATAQMQYRLGLATGNGDAVKNANKTFYQIPREIFSRQDPRLFAAEVVCDGYLVAANSMPIPQCQNIEWRYNEATKAIRRDVEARIVAANFAIYRASGRRTPLKGRGAADRAANLLIRKHGADAELEAAKRRSGADLMLEWGDDEGARVDADQACN